MSRATATRRKVSSALQDGQAAWLEKVASRFEPKEQYLIPILQYIQSEAGYLPPEAMRAAARHLRISESKVYGVASFYAQFHFEPRGRHKITICRGTACHVRGSARLVEEMESFLGVKPGGTTADLGFTLETVACVGACALAPLVVIDGKAYGRQTPSSLKKVVSALGESVAGEPKPAPKKEKEVPATTVTAEQKAGGAKAGDKTVASKKTVKKKATKKKSAGKKATKNKTTPKKVTKKKTAGKKVARKTASRAKGGKKTATKKRTTKKKARGTKTMSHRRARR